MSTHSPSTGRSDSGASAQGPLGSRCLAVIGPTGAPKPFLASLAAGGLAIGMPALADADDDTILGVTVATLACDAVVAVLPATVGLDAGTAAVWQHTADRGLPRAVVVTELGLHTAGFEDLAAIASRGLADDCVPIRLPVFDDGLWGGADDEAPAAAGVDDVVDPLTASLSLVSGVLRTSGEDSPAEAGHMHVCEDMRTNVVAAAARYCDDPEWSSRLLSALEAEADGDALRFGAGVRTLEIGDEEGFGGDSQPVYVWDITPALVSAASAGHFVPVTVDLPPGTAAADLWVLWRQLSPHVRLVRRDVHDHSTTGFAAMVLQADGTKALARVVFDAPAADPIWQAGASHPVMITRPGETDDDNLAADRSWPGLITIGELASAGLAADDHSGECWEVSAIPPVIVGDAIVYEHTWVVPEELL